MALTMGEKIDDLIEVSGKTPKQICDEIYNQYGVSISQATISDIINGKDKGYSYKYFVALADYFNVSIDYLLTDTEIKTTDKDLQFICDYTGLSEDTIAFLRIAKKSLLLDFLEHFIYSIAEDEIFAAKNMKVFSHKIAPFHIDNEPLSKSIKFSKKIMKLRSKMDKIGCSDIEWSEKQSIKREIYKLETPLNGNKYHLTNAFNTALNEFIEIKAGEDDE